MIPGNFGIDVDYSSITDQHCGFYIEFETKLWAACFVIDFYEDYVKLFLND